MKSKARGKRKPPVGRPAKTCAELAERIRRQPRLSRENADSLERGMVGNLCSRTRMTNLLSNWRKNQVVRALCYPQRSRSAAGHAPRNRVNWQKVDDILARVPNVPPLPGDELP